MDIVILKQEKWNGVVILNRIDCIKGINDIINDKNKFKELPNDPTINREGKLQRFLSNLKNKDKIDKNIYNSLALIYGVPNMHKENPQMKYHRLDPLYPPLTLILIV